MLTTLVSATAVVTACQLSLADEPAFTNGTLKSCTTAWSAAESWAEGVPANGPGATVSIVQNGSFAKLDVSPTIGHILVPETANVLADKNGLFQLSCLDGNLTLAATYAGAGSQTNSDSRAGAAPRSLKLDSGSASDPATIQVLSPTETAGDGKFRLFIEPDIELNSDLYLKHRGAPPVSNKASTYQVSGSSNPYHNYMMTLAGRISEKAGEKHGVTVENGHYYDRTVFGGDNRFTGDFRVTTGSAIAYSPRGYETEFHPFGVSNSVYATSGTGGIDLRGNIVGRDQRLFLGGGTVGAIRGALYSTCQNNGVTADWTGDVTLTSDVSIGYPNPSFDTIGTFLEGGNLRISGDIDGTGVLTVNGRRLVSLTGANTWTGGIRLSGGVLTARKGALVADQPFVFAGGVYRYEGPDSADISLCATDCANTSRAFMLDVPKGVTYVPAKTLFKRNFTDASAGFAFSGGGTLVITNAMAGTMAQQNPGFVYQGGTVIWDARGRNMTFYTANRRWYLDDSTIVYRGLAADCQESSYASWMQGYTVFSNETKKVVKFGDMKGGRGAVVDFAPPTSTGSFYWNPNWGAAARTAETAAAPSVLRFYGLEDGAKIAGAVALWDGVTFATADTGSFTVKPFADEDYATEWGVAKAGFYTATNAVVDVTPELCAASELAPVRLEAGLLRFNTPSPDGQPLVLHLADGSLLAGGVALFTRNLGTTDVKITGGTLRTRSTDENAMIFVNNCLDNTVELDTTVVNHPTSGKATHLALNGRGRFRLSGVNRTTGSLLLTCATVEFASGGDMLPMASGNLANVSCAGNPTVLFTSSHDLTAHSARKTGGSAASYNVAWTVSNAGVTFDVQGAESVATVADTGAPKTGTMNLGGLGRIVKRGTGVLKWGTPITVSAAHAYDIKPYLAPTISIEGGVLQSVGDWQGDASCVGVTHDVSNGATLRDAMFLNGYAGECYYNSSFDTGSRRTVRVGEGGMTFDCRTSAAKSYVPFVYTQSGRAIDSSNNGFFRNLGGWTGCGDIVITNSYPGASGSLASWMFSDRQYRGRLTCALPLTLEAHHGGIEFARAVWHVPAGVTHQLDGVMPKCANRFGGLTGSGTVTLTDPDDMWADSRLCVGRDADEILEFSGTLKGVKGYRKNALNVVKTGSNAWRLKGDDNSLVDNVFVSDGELRVAAAANASLVSPCGALGTGKVIVGDETTPDGRKPSLLLEDGVICANAINVPALSPASATPVVGAADGAGETTFAGRLTAYRPVTLFAGSGATARFTGGVTFVGAAAAISKGGVGNVVISGDFSTGDTYAWNGGTLETEGRVTIPSGATLDIDTSVLSPTRPPEGTEYVILSAAGGITGSFATIPPLPGQWTVRCTSKRVVLRWGNPGLMLILR